MTEELKQAAQAALEALEEIALAGMSGTGQESEEGLRDWHARQAWKFIGIAARELEPLRRALTQRPAAQTEREAFEAWFDDYYDKACAEFGGIDCTNPKGIAEDAWQAHASLPAQPAAQDEREADEVFLPRRLAATQKLTQLGYRYDSAHGKWLPAPQQATPEPVGTVVAWLYTEDGETKFGHPQGHRPKDARPLVFGDVRPAPGVPALSKDQIRDVFLAHGFTIKEGQSDLKPYVFEAAEALLKLAGTAPGVPGDLATIAGLHASVGHLSRLIDEQTMLLARAMQAMKKLHESASQDDGPDLNAIIPAGAFHEFVDDNAALRYAIAQSPISIDAATAALAAAQAKGGQ